MAIVHMYKAERTGLPFIPNNHHDHPGVELTNNAASESSSSLVYTIYLPNRSTSTLRVLRPDQAASLLFARRMRSWEQSTQAKMPEMIPHQLLLLRESITAELLEILALVSQGVVDAFHHFS